MKKCRIQSGFTLIETLVAIAILMVAIAGPLNIAEKALVTAVSSRDQTIASYLAQDLMEYVENIRDNNIINNPNSSSAWLNYISQCTVTNPCISETSGTANPPPSITAVPTCTFSGTPVVLSSTCRLYIDATNKYYTYVSGIRNQATEFYRTFSLTPLDSGSNSTSNIDLLTVSVYWTNGTLLNKVILQSIIFNTHR